jgi:hypothetical protein
VSDQLSKDENVCSCLNGIRFVPKMPPLLGHAPIRTSPASNSGVTNGLIIVVLRKSALSPKHRRPKDVPGLTAAIKRAG